MQKMFPAISPHYSQRKTLHSNIVNESPTALTVSTKQLMELLNCGKPTAVKVGVEAGAKIVVGERKILWNLNLIRQYLDSMAQ